MKFHLVDKIKSIDPGKRIVTTKALSLAEEYLADHFPAFPVLPGVMMLEALAQAGAWLVRVEQDFANSLIVLSGVRNVKYSSFVAPGDVLRCEMEALEISEGSAKFKGVGSVGERQTVSGRIELRCFNLRDEKGSYLADADAAIVEQLRKQFKLIGGPGALAQKRSEASGTGEDCPGP